MNDIIFIGGILTPQIEKWIQDNSIGGIQYAADTLQKCFIEGLAIYNDDIKVLNIPYIGSYPKFFKKRYFKGTSEILRLGNKNVSCQNISFNNIAIVKNWSRYRQLKSSLTNYLNNAENTITLIIYAVHSPFLKACSEIKEKYPNVKIVLIVPDLPEFMSASESLALKFVKKISNWICYSSYTSIDAFVFLTEAMNERINISGKPYIVIEGIFSQSDDNAVLTNINRIDNPIKNIVYSGTLARRYGIVNLVEAFNKIQRDDIKLTIIGSGDSEHIILNKAMKDKRISFMGQLPHNEVLKIQSQAFLLVNPRTSVGEFTKYSFPSKTMEYLASGTPTLLNKLQGIPNEYYSYCFQPKDESVDSLRIKMEEILSMPNSILNEIGNKAQQFIWRSKNPASQCSKLMQLINHINKS